METETYSSEFGKSLAFGVSALVKGKKDYYILEHLVSSEYHTAGEKQEIMLDKVILGRDTDCHVRFDESFITVSRHHASIVRDDDKWRLVQLSKMNTTFLNGNAVQDSWYLQSGDEIQLAVNGPKLVFRAPEDTSGMSFSQRLDSFRDQVIRPYRTAFIVVCCVVVLIIAGCVMGGVIIKKQRDNIAALNELNEKQREQIDLLYTQLLQTNEDLAATAIQADSANQSAILARSEAFKAKAEQIKAQENLQDVQEQMKQLQNEMNSFYNGILNGGNPEIEDVELNDGLLDGENNNAGESQHED